MPRPIVVPLLDSVFSTRALPALTGLAHRCDAELHLLDLRAADPDAAAMTGPRLQQESRVRSIRDAYCAQIAAQAAEWAGSGRVRTAYREGDTLRELVRYAVAVDAVLVSLVLENREMAGEAGSRTLAREVSFRSGAPVLLLISRSDGSREVSLEGVPPNGIRRDDLLSILDPPLIGA